MSEDFDKKVWVGDNLKFTLRKFLFTSRQFPHDNLPHEILPRAIKAELWRRDMHHLVVDKGPMTMECLQVRKDRDGTMMSRQERVEGMMLQLNSHRQFMLPPAVLRWK